MSAVQTFLRHAGQSDQSVRTAHHAVILPCHAPWLSGDPADPRNWLVHDYQQKDIQLYIEHLKAAIEETARDTEALLIISGGPTRSRFRISESRSHHLLALKFGLLEDPSLAERVVLEEHARDSYENLVYSICAFSQVAGRMPSQVTVVGFGFKGRRFKHHAETPGLGPEQFKYRGVNDPPDLAEAEANEARTLEAFVSDPHGTGPLLQEKRDTRSPYGHHPPYPHSCNRFTKLAKLLWLNAGRPSAQIVRTFINYFYQCDSSDWRVRDNQAAARLRIALSEMGYRWDSDIVERPARWQFDGSFDAPCKESGDGIQWSGSAGDYAYVRNTDLLVWTTRPPLDEDGRKPLGRTHTWLERALLETSRGFFDTCSRKHVKLAEPFARRLLRQFAHYASIHFSVYERRKTGAQQPPMAEYQKPDPKDEPGPTPTEPGKTCCYLTYCGADNPVGCPVLNVFGLSGADTYRFAAALVDEGPLSELLAEVLTKTGKHKQLVMVEFTPEKRLYTVIQPEPTD